MPKKDSPITLELVKEVVTGLGGRAHLDQIFDKVMLMGPLTEQITSRYPTDTKLRSRLVVVLSQSGEFERVGDQRSATYKIREGVCPWKRM